jgi:hypothetical protein
MVAIIFFLTGLMFGRITSISQVRTETASQEKSTWHAVPDLHGRGPHSTFTLAVAIPFSRRRS